VGKDRKKTGNAVCESWQLMTPVAQMEKVKQAVKRRKMEQWAKKGNMCKEQPAEALDDAATTTGRVSFGSNEVRVCDEANKLIHRENLACTAMIVTPPKAKAAK